MPRYHGEHDIDGSVWDGPLERFTPSSEWRARNPNDYTYNAAGEPVYPHGRHPQRLRGVITADRCAEGIALRDSGATKLVLSRREAQFLMMRLAEALIDGA
jgi:hypothetical protein